jgi:hypothetical protein
LDPTTAAAPWFHWGEVRLSSAGPAIWHCAIKHRREAGFVAEDGSDGEFGALEWQRYDRCTHRRSSSSLATNSFIKSMQWAQVNQLIHHVKSSRPSLWSQ